MQYPNKYYAELGGRVISIIKPRDTRLYELSSAAFHSTSVEEEKKSTKE